MDSQILRLAVLLLLLGCAGCVTSNTPLTAAAAAPILQYNPFDRLESRPDIFLSGGLKGKLIRQDQCLIIKATTGNVTPLWPIGTTLITSERRLAVELPDKGGIAQIGNQVKLSGSTLPRGDEYRIVKASRPSCPPTYFVVSGVEQ